VSDLCGVFLQDFCGILKKIVQDKVQDFSTIKRIFRTFSATVHDFAISEVAALLGDE
jgi:hypothetical protein